MSLIIVDTPELLEAETTYLSNDYYAGETNLGVQNPQGYYSNEFVIVGKPGSEKTELRRVDGTTASAITIAGLTFPHEAGTPVYRMKYDQARIYRADSHEGSMSLIATINLEFDIPEGTMYEDNEGTSESYYAISWYNSITHAESGQTGRIRALGLSINSLDSITDDILVLIGDPEAKYISREQVRQKINRHQITWWLSPYSKRELTREINLKTIAGQNYIALPAYFDRLKDEYAVYYRYNPVSGTDKGYCLKIRSKAAFREHFNDFNAVDNDQLKECYVDDYSYPKRLYLGPTPASADKDLYVDAFIRPTDLASGTDETLCVHPGILSFGVAAEICYSQGKDGKGDRYTAIKGNLDAGDVAHNRNHGGSVELKFRKDYGKGRFHA